MIRVAKVDEGVDVGFEGAVTARFHGRMETEPRAATRGLCCAPRSRAEPTSPSSSRCASGSSHSYQFTSSLFNTYITESYVDLSHLGAWYGY